MSKNPAKDFGPIAEDYAFFEVHATEAEEDARAYAEQLAGSVPVEGVIRMLDFGCGSGTFTAYFLQQARWPATRLQLTLIEPVQAARRQAVERLGAYTKHPVEDAASLPAGTSARFDIILANHVFYYVPVLRSHLARLIDALTPAGVFVTAIAARTNALYPFWVCGFGSLGREVPYNTSEDVEEVLQALGAGYRKQLVPYQLVFPDTEENRMRILHFLLANHLAHMPPRPLLDLFNQFADSGWIKIQTASDHYTIHRSSHADPANRHGSAD